jgi:uncharacterized membrane protein YeaQ/YmgE (transglycosylase-associated protein family)
MQGVGIFGFLIIGLAAGWIAGKVMNSRHGLITNLVVGIIGAYLGPWVGGLLGISFAGFLGSLVMASLGAILFVYLLRLVKGRG